MGGCGGVYWHWPHWVKAVILSFTQWQAFTQFPLSGGPFVLGRIHSDSSRLVILQKHVVTESVLGLSYGFLDVNLNDSILIWTVLLLSFITLTYKMVDTVSKSHFLWLFLFLRQSHTLMYTFSELSLPGPEGMITWHYILNLLYYP